MDEDIFYHKKPNTKKIVLLSILCLLVIAFIYLISFFVINPTQLIKIINSGEMTPAYSRDYIFSIVPDITNTDMENLDIIINEDVNTTMSESLQYISLSAGENTFDWERFFKFDIGVLKTPYDSRYIRFDNFSESYYHQYSKNESNLTALLIKYLDSKSNLFFDANHYDEKKLKVYNEGLTLFDKLKVNYEISFDQSTSQAVFEELLETVWNSNDMFSFFMVDDDIQAKLGIKNNTKELLDIIYNIKNISSVNSLTVGLLTNKDFIESITYEFDIDYVADGKTYNLMINIGEYLKSFEDDRSPEDMFAPMSITNYNDLVPYVKEKPETDNEQYEEEISDSMADEINSAVESGSTAPQDSENDD